LYAIAGQPHSQMVEWYRDRLFDAYILSWLGRIVDRSCIYWDAELGEKRSYTRLSAEFSGLKTRR